MRQLKIATQITDRRDLSLSRYLNEVSSIPMITPQEEAELCSIIQGKDYSDLEKKKAIEKLTKSNLRFVISVSKQYNMKNSSMGLGDIISAGNSGLIKAAELFDSTRGFKFISYAVWWIRQSILKELSENGQLIRKPLNKLAEASKVKKAKIRFEQELGRSCTVDELIIYCNENQIIRKDRTPLEILRLLNLDKDIQSGDAFVSEDSDMRFIDTIASEYGNDVEDRSENDFSKRQVEKFLSILSYKEREVVSLHYGINCDYAMSLDEIGIKLELSKERVRQIREKALRKIKSFYNRQRQQSSKPINWDK